MRLFAIEKVRTEGGSQIAKNAKNKRYINESPKKLHTVLCTPLGYMLTRYIHYKVKVDKCLTF